MSKMKDLLFTKYTNRFSPWRKQKFRNAIKAELEFHGYDVIVEKKLFSTNLYFGNINSQYVLTAHYDTATNMAIFYPFMKLFGARVGQFIAILPIVLVVLFAPAYYLQFVTCVVLLIFIGLLIPNRYNYNDNSSGVLTILEHAIANKDSKDYYYALTDNEEKGLFGAKALHNFLKKNNRLGYIKNINIDCVGTGNDFLLATTGPSVFFNQAYASCSEYLDIRKVQSKLLASDHFVFGKQGIMITKVNQAKYTNDIYIPHLHTNRDKVIDYANIDICLELINKITGKA